MQFLKTRRIAGILFISINIFLTNNPEIYADNKIVFVDDGFGQNIENHSWNTGIGTAMEVYKGVSSTVLNYTGAWAGLDLRYAPTFDSTQFAALSFAIKGIQSPSPSLYVELIDANGIERGYVTLANYLPAGTLMPGWQVVSIPLSDLLSKRPPFYAPPLSPINKMLGVVIQTDRAATVYIDKIEIVGAERFLSFPLRNRTPYTAEINTVFDHSMSTRFCGGSVITAYTGEQGRKEYGKLYETAFKCLGVKNDLYSFKNKNGTNFVINRHYKAGGAPLYYLAYDGHPAFDYRTRDQSADGIVDVLAAADGTVESATRNYGTIKINHWNGYKTAYTHLSKCFINGVFHDINENQGKVCEGMKDLWVNRGDVIGKTGGTGADGQLNEFGPHLHFEVIEANTGIVVDPYGWQGSGSDPYTGLTGLVNIELWQ